MTIVQVWLFFRVWMGGGVERQGQCVADTDGGQRRCGFGPGSKLGISGNKAFHCRRAFPHFMDNSILSGLSVCNTSLYSESS